MVHTDSTHARAVYVRTGRRLMVPLYLAECSVINFRIPFRLHFETDLILNTDLILIQFWHGSIQRIFFSLEYIMN